MRSLVVLALLPAFIACKHSTPELEKLIVEETQLAEVLEPKPVGMKDSIKLTIAFSNFMDAIEHRDGLKIARLSVDGVYWPASLNQFLRTPFDFPKFLITLPPKSWYKVSIAEMEQSRKYKLRHWTDGEYNLSFEVPKRVRDRIEYETFDFMFTKLANAFLFKELRNYTHSYRNITPSIDTIITYFPRADSSGIRYRQLGRMSNYENISYSQILAALQEPVLKAYRGPKEVYRLTWLRAFHLPVSVRIEDSSDRYSIESKILQQRDDEFPDEILVNNHQHINFFAWNKFKSKIENADFWNMPLEDSLERPNDGSQWVLEGTKNGKYHVVCRWSPHYGGFRDACWLLINITTLPIKQKDIY